MAGAVTVDLRHTVARPSPDLIAGIASDAGETLLVIGAITLLSTNIGNELKKVAGILVN